MTGKKAAKLEKSDTGRNTKKDNKEDISVGARPTEEAESKSESSMESDPFEANSLDDDEGEINAEKEKVRTCKIPSVQVYSKQSLFTMFSLLHDNCMNLLVTCKRRGYKILLEFT